jgi:hypothetical protein
VAKELCEGGAKIVMLEAGKEVRPSDLVSHKWPTNFASPICGVRNRRTFIRRSCCEGEPVRGPDGFRRCAEIRLAVYNCSGNGLEPLNGCTVCGLLGARMELFV